MTPDEQDRLISGMVKERNELRRERCLIAEQVTQTRKGMKQAAIAANLVSQQTDAAIDLGFAYQDADAFRATLLRGHEVAQRLAELDERLDAC